MEEVRYCRGCGRQMVPTVRSAGIDSQTGERMTEVVLLCPRFSRSWRNLWLGGWGHYGSIPPDKEDGQFVGFELEIAWR